MFKGFEQLGKTYWEHDEFGMFCLRVQRSKYGNLVLVVDDGDTVIERINLDKNPELYDIWDWKQSAFSQTMLDEFMMAAVEAHYVLDKSA
jgi:hypothetical protein